MEEKAIVVAQLLKILANEQRLLILCALSEKELTVSEIHKYTPNITQSALSQHLGQLKISKILTSKKKGMNVFYSILDTRVTVLLETIKEQYCK